MPDSSYIVDGVLTEGESWVPLLSSTLDATTQYIDIALGEGVVGSTVLNATQYAEIIVIGSLRQVDSDYASTVQVYYGQNVTDANAYFEGFWYGASQNSDFKGGISNGYAGYSAAASADANIFTGFISRFGPQTGLFKTAKHWMFNDVNYQSTEKQLCVAYTTKFSQQGIDTIRYKRAASGFAAGSRIDVYGVLPRMAQ